MTSESYISFEMSAADMEIFDDPFALFECWFEDARMQEPNDPNAMALATVDAQGLPNVRMVLLKGVDKTTRGGEGGTPEQGRQEAGGEGGTPEQGRQEAGGEGGTPEQGRQEAGGEGGTPEQGTEKRGFVFFTNYESHKGQELLGQGKAALCFHWKSLRRQVRLRGIIEQVSEQEADDYYHSRPRGSQIGAWASQQSRPLANRTILEQAVAEHEARFAGEEVIPRPPYWSGFRLLPLTIEFWHDRPFRLHDRLVFSRDDVESSWQKMRFYP